MTKFRVNCNSLLPHFCRWFCLHHNVFALIHSALFRTFYAAIPEIYSNFAASKRLTIKY